MERGIDPLIIIHGLVEKLQRAMCVTPLELEMSFKCNVIYAVIVHRHADTHFVIYETNAV